ncbi:Protein of unknown function [Paenibacillus sp. UNCCL117]|uniref:DUF2487 family protein n=1 Tax=unclassified Paenibacillus TaxID=185978 RepID=UPI00088903A3|nr:MULTISPECIES: DUF2487 family protein [unclassified Paenibacillus]SDC41274.1 Protein of unknown function [Paenibacillus sp. cl123]SFW13570.1 Protein of unknown function [Paenibacillus sp. UNCCL117]
MKFSEIETAAWPELKPYLDTALIPVTGLEGSESPVEAADALEVLRDVLDLIEIPFKGRTVTYPAMHYTGGGQAAAAAQLLVQDACARMKLAGFRYVVLVTASPDDALEAGLRASEADLVLRLTREDMARLGADAKRSIAESLTKLWLGRESV